MLNLAASEWIDGHNLTWLAAAPKIKLLKVSDARQPYPLFWDEQAKLFAELPSHLAGMALFAVNTGLRNREVCELRWEWEVPVPELETSVFLIPGPNVKNGEQRLVVLNDVAKSLIESLRHTDTDTEFVFPFRVSRSGPCITPAGKWLELGRDWHT